MTFALNGIATKKRQKGLFISFVDEKHEVYSDIKKHPDSVKIYQRALENGHITLDDMTELNMSVVPIQQNSYHRPL